MKPRVILFDLDDTLLDRRQALVVYAERFQEKFAPILADSETYETIKKAVIDTDGTGYRRRLEVAHEMVELLAWRDQPQAEVLFEHWQTVFPTCAQPVAGMREVLDNLQEQGYILGLITNGLPVLQRTKIDVLKIESYMKTILVSEEIGLRKPGAEIFRRALQELNAQAAETWYIGDHPVNDVVGARGAGLTPVWRSGIHPWPEDVDKPERVIVSLGELLPMVAGIRQ